MKKDEKISIFLLLATVFTGNAFAGPKVDPNNSAKKSKENQDKNEESKNTQDDSPSIVQSSELKIQENENPQKEDTQKDEKLGNADFLVGLKRYLNQDDSFQKSEQFGAFCKEFVSKIEGLAPHFLAQQGEGNWMKVEDFGSPDFVAFFIPGLEPVPILSFIDAAFIPSCWKDYICDIKIMEELDTDDEKLCRVITGLESLPLKVPFFKEQVTRLVNKIQEYVKQCYQDNSLSDDEKWKKLFQHISQYIDDLLLDDPFSNKFISSHNASYHEGMRVEEPVPVDTKALLDLMLKEKVISLFIRAYVPYSVADISPQVLEKFQEGQDVSLLNGQYDSVLMKDQDTLKIKGFPEVCAKFRVMLPGECVPKDGMDPVTGAIYVMQKPEVSLKECSHQDEIDSMQTMEHVTWGERGAYIAEQLKSPIVGMKAVMEKFLEPVHLPHAKESDFMPMLDLFLKKSCSCEVETGEDNKIPGKDFCTWIKKKVKVALLAQGEMDKLLNQKETLHLLNDVTCEFPVSYAMGAYGVVGPYKMSVTPEDTGIFLKTGEDIEISDPFFIKDDENHPKAYISLDVMKVGPEDSSEQKKIGHVRIFEYLPERE